MQPIIVTIAGSDSSGGAGIQADLKSIAACGGYGASVITAITAQSTRGVAKAEELSPALIRAQFDAVFDDLDVAACKTGMLASTRVISEVAAALDRWAPPSYVCDPVMISKSGFPLLQDDAVDALVSRLLPRAALVTPNVHEASRLAGFPVTSIADAHRAARAIRDRGAAAVLVKGGHLADRPGTDVLDSPDGVVVLEGEWIDTTHTHGTGCTYSAAIATHLGRGFELEDAVRRAKRFLGDAIRHGLPIGHGAGPTDPFFFLRAQSSWPSTLRDEPPTRPPS
jgi:hydroxymethylpyrimidine/phosphomethylpyrimidine kinase